MAARPLALALVLAAAATLAGCAGKAAAPQDPAADVHVAATATTGVIRGITLDTALHPIAGARVSLKQGDQPRTALSSGTGSFGFEGLAPGTYFLDAAKKGFLSARVSVEVQAGVSEPAVTKIALTANPSDRPFYETFLFKGFLECGVTTPATGVALCFAAKSVGNLTSDHTQVDIAFAPNLTWLQSEMIWTPTNPAGKDLSLWHSYTCPGQSLYCDHGPSGPSPLLVVDNQTWVDTLGLNAGNTLYMRVFSAELEGTHPPPPADHACVPDPALGGQVCLGGAGVGLEQDFVIYTHGFHNFTPPEGYRFSKDGDPVLPPA